MGTPVELVEQPIREKYAEHLEQLAYAGQTETPPPGRMDPLTAVRAEVERLCKALEPVLELGSEWREVAELNRIEIDAGSMRDFADAEQNRAFVRRQDLLKQLMPLFAAQQDDLKRLRHWHSIEEELSKASHLEPAAG